MIYTKNDYREILKEELGRRVQKNPQYSLQAYGRDLGLSKGQLSDVLNYKKGLSESSAKNMAKKLGLNPLEEDLFVCMVNSQHARGRAKRELAHKRLQRIKTAKVSKLEFDAFNVISDWYHFALMELAKTLRFKHDVRWMAGKLGISVELAHVALERLDKLNILKMVNGKWIPQRGVVVKSPTEIPSETIREHHRQILDKARKALSHQSVKERYFQTTTMAIDSSLLPQAKKLIAEFQAQMNELLTQNQSKKDKVYCLSTQLFCLEENYP